VGVGGDFQAEVVCFVDRGLQFLQGELGMDCGLLPWVRIAPVESTLMWSAPLCANRRTFCRTSQGLLASP
jgi:hypothetical protein